MTINSNIILFGCITVIYMVNKISCIYSCDIIKRININSPLWKCPIFTIKETNFTSQKGEDKFVINYFISNNISLFNRIYLEVGAFDGYKMSNTYALEHAYGWKGLLIEGSPNIFKELLLTDRPRSIKINKAICSEDGYVEYLDEKNGLGGVKKYIGNRNKTKKVIVQCSPISKVIKENGIRYIDVFSLDVEGAEEDVLKTFDWTIPIRIWIIELNALKLGGTEIEKQKCKIVQNILMQHGYTFIGTSSPQSVNEFYINPNFDKMINQFIKEDENIYRINKCYK